jgi:hypothetical protein
MTCLPSARLPVVTATNATALGNWYVALTSFASALSTCTCPSSVQKIKRETASASSATCLMTPSAVADVGRVGGPATVWLRTNAATRLFRAFT